MQGAGHRFVVAAGELPHEVWVEVVGDAIDSINRGLELVLLLPGDIKNAIGVPAPFRLDDVPDLLDRVELAALRRQELVVEERVVELLLDIEAVMDREVVHDHYPLLEWMDPLELLDERQEGVHGVAAEENLSKH